MGIGLGRGVDEKRTRKRVGGKRTRKRVGGKRTRKRGAWG